LSFWNVIRNSEKNLNKLYYNLTIKIGYYLIL